MPDLENYHYPKQYATLLANTKNHEMRVLHEDGLYRHLRFQEPGTGMWHWDLITWPGSLAIRGDIGLGLIFTRTDDMLSFFDHGQGRGWINPSYWAEKLDRGARSVRDFSSDRFQAWVGDRRSWKPDLIAEAGEIEHTSAAIDFCDEHGIDWDIDTPDSWMDYEYHFILALHAILWGAKKYHAAKASVGASKRAAD